MKTIKKIQIEVEEIEAITCNKCGKTVSETAMDYDNHYSGSHTGGYASEGFDDGTEYTFDLCEPCLKEFINSFTVKPSIIDHMGWGIDYNENPENKASSD
jgi:hypothetical protein